MIGDWIRAKAERNGDRQALEVAGETRTYAQLDAGTDRTAAGLAALGLAPGDKACLMMRNSAANVEAWLGMCKAGIVEVPINTANNCEERMARFAVPRYVRVLDELPRTPSQRLQKYKLREAGVTADTWDVSVHS